MRPGRTEGGGDELEGVENLAQEALVTKLRSVKERFGPLGIQGREYTQQLAQKVENLPVMRDVSLDGGADGQVRTSEELAARRLRMERVKPLLCGQPQLKRLTVPSRPRTAQRDLILNHGFPRRCLGDLGPAVMLQSS